MYAELNEQQRNVTVDALRHYRQALMDRVNGEIDCLGSTMSVDDAELALAPVNEAIEELTPDAHSAWDYEGDLR